MCTGCVVPTKLIKKPVKELLPPEEKPTCKYCDFDEEFCLCSSSFYTLQEYIHKEFQLPTLYSYLEIKNG